MISRRRHDDPGQPPEVSARLLALFRAELAPQEVWLYGSRAMGGHRSGSNINLSLHHDLPEPLRQPVAWVGRRLAPCSAARDRVCRVAAAAGPARCWPMPPLPWNGAELAAATDQAAAN